MQSHHQWCQTSRKLENALGDQIETVPDIVNVEPFGHLMQKTRELISLTQTGQSIIIRRGKLSLSAGVSIMIPEKATLTLEEGKTDGGIFYRKTYSSTSQDTLVLVMGYGGSLRIWPSTFIDRLAEKFHVVTYDNRGTGLSIIPQEASDYTIKAMADDLYEVVKSLKIDKHHLLGYSMGSCIALQYAHDHSEIVKSLFLMCGTAGGAEYVKPEKAISTALANPQGKTLWDIYMYTWQLMYSPEQFERCQPAFKAIYEASKDMPTRPLALLGHSHAFRGFDGSTYLEKLKMPTTLLAGRNDRLMPYLNSENLTKISGSKIVLLDDCEHGPHIQNEDAVIEEIERSCRNAIA